ncbi:MAG TPA: GFA family protein [Candidatus Binatia bacterium]|nr:GFA family protein [Candidatus Binatia bacterium]
MKTFTGGCHCGRVRYRVEADLATASDCNCSMCAKKGFLHVIVPRDRFHLLSGQDDLTTYEFNTRTAKHLFCRHCGIHSFYVPRSDPDKIDVNARCLDGIDLSQINLTRFDGQNWEAAFAAERGHASKP